MIISCPQCGTAYDVPDAASVAGRKVRCRACRNVWRVDALPDDAALGELNGIAGDDRGAAAPADPFTSLQAPNYGSNGRPPAVGAAPAWDAEDRDVPDARASGRRLDDGSAALSLGRAGVPASLPPPPLQQSGPADAERQRNGRNRSGFDDVEAAIEAVRTAPPDDPAGLHDAQFFDASRLAPAAVTVAPVRVPPSGGEQAARANGAAAHRYASKITGPEGEEFTVFGDDEGFEDARSAGRAAAIIGWVALIALIAGFGAFGYMGSSTVVRLLPATAPVYAALGIPVNVRGLEFAGVAYEWQIDPRGRPAISIKGEVRNISREARSVPSVVVSFLDQDGLELFDWATPMRLSALQPGASAPFSTLVPAPPESVRKVEIRFAKARR